MIFFLYGQDTYRSKEKLAEIVIGYRKAHKADFNLKHIDCSEISFTELEDEARQKSIFKEKKMFVLTNAFSNEKLKEDFIKKGKSFISSESITVFYEENKILKKDILFRFLTKQAKIQEFILLSEARLKKWVLNEFKKAGALIEEKVADELVFAVGNDLWRMTNEIKKLVCFKAGEKIGLKDVQAMVRAKIDLNIFETIDAIASKDRKRALKLLKNHLKKGDSPFYLSSMINYQFRNLLVVKDLLVHNIPIDAFLNLKPFVIRKSIALARRFDFEELKKIYQNIFEVDLKIKTGKIDSEAALELLILEV